jgi:hypothetical protein
MLVYNVTVKIEHNVHQDWLEWMQNHHIPEVMATGFFENCRLCKVIGDEDTHGITYAVQYDCPNMESFVAYQAQHAPRLQADHASRYPNQYVSFRTLLEVL